MSTSITLHPVGLGQVDVVLLVGVKVVQMTVVKAFGAKFADLRKKKIWGCL